MKNQFSTHWNSSKQPRKQRKFRANAPLHIRHKMISANLSKELRKKYSRRSFPLRKGDNVKVMAGSFKGKAGKVGIVNLKKLKVTIEGLQKQKKDGTKINIYFQPSNLQIQELNLGDKKREMALMKKIHNQREENEKMKETKDKIKEKENAPQKK